MSVAQPSSELAAQTVWPVGRGYSARKLRHMVRFAEAFPDSKTMHALSTQFGCTHFRHFLPLDDPLKRDFYAEMCCLEKGNTADAVSDRASGIIVAHNHPAGGLEPSPAEAEVTCRLKQAGENLGIVLLDHIIFNRSSYFSFLEAGKL